MPIEVSIGRFGPYIKHDDKFKSIPKSYSIFDLSLSDAIAIIEAPGRVSTKGKEIGKHPNDDKPIVLKKENLVTIFLINQRISLSQRS